MQSKYLTLFVSAAIAAVILSGCSSNNADTTTATASNPNGAPAAQSRPPQSPQEQIDRYKKMQQQGNTAPPASAPR